MARPRLPEKQYPAPGTMTTSQVQARLGITYRQLAYLRTHTELVEHPFNQDKAQRREWPEDIVARLEVAVAVARALPLSHARMSQLPAIVEAVLAAERPPERGWVLFDERGIDYSPWRIEDLNIGAGGVVARIPAPWGLSVTPRPEADARWAVVEDYTE